MPLYPPFAAQRLFYSIRSTTTNHITTSLLSKTRKTPYKPPISLIIQPTRSFAMDYQAKSHPETQEKAPEVPEKPQDALVFAPPTEQYYKSAIDIPDMLEDPIEQFKQWYEQATQLEKLAESTTLSTAHLPSGRVSSRIVLFKELDKRGFVVFSNWGTSRKSKDIKSNPFAALTFFWKNAERQVRIEGPTEFLSHEESQIYFNTRPRGSRIGAWASPQSSKLKDRHELEELYKQKEKEFEGVDVIPCPPFWGGLRIIPDYIEFWQGRPSRLHDRIVYEREGEGKQWEISRIAS